MIIFSSTQTILATTFNHTTNTPSIFNTNNNLSINSKNLFSLLSMFMSMVFHQTLRIKLSSHFVKGKFSHQLFSINASFGEILSCKAIINFNTNECKGFGFVLFSNMDACDKAIEELNALGYQASMVSNILNL